MPKIRFHVAYDGTDFCGWQRQNHGDVPSVAQTLENALTKVLDEDITLYASGRTDAGVHALNQVCHFSTTKEFKKGWDLCWALNAQLPKSVVVKKAWYAPEQFHATLSATHKTYRYWVLNRHRPSPHLARNAHWIRQPISIDFLNQCSEIIKGYHDFKSFQSVGTPVLTTDREIFEAKWSYRRPDLLQFQITGSGFLKQMVRNIVGTQLMLERKGQTPEKMREILELKDRTKAGPPAPAEGLYLFKVYYPPELDKGCLEI